METEIYHSLLDMGTHRDYITRGRLVEMILIKERIDQRVSTILRDQGEIIRNGAVLTGKRQDLTPDMIERARQYPFEELIEFRRNVTLCPFHDDRHPSMGLKNNYVRCFSCGWKGDTLKFVIEKEGLSFPDAVKRLQ